MKYWRRKGCHVHLPFAIGVGSGLDGAFYTGLFDEFSFTRRILSEEEILSNYNNQVNAISNLKIDQLLDMNSVNNQVQLIRPVSSELIEVFDKFQKRPHPRKEYNALEGTHRSYQC